MTTTTLPKAHSSIVEATELPRIIKVTDNLYAAAFSLMKLLPARYILDRAEAAGLISPAPGSSRPPPAPSRWAWPWSAGCAATR